MAALASHSEGHLDCTVIETTTVDDNTSQVVDVTVEVNVLKGDTSGTTTCTEPVVITPPAPAFEPHLQPFFPSIPATTTPPLLDFPVDNIQPTIFDAELISLPLAPYDEYHASIRYPNRFNDDGSAYIPSPPPEIDEVYLYPTLSHNERQRLTSLWYYTRSMQRDKRLLTHLQDTVDLTRDVLDHDCAILGLLDNDSYTRLVTSNVELAVIPRREATCSHTINQQPGTVFMIPDCGKDWRFSSSPHVKAGLGSYAGTQLRYKLPESDVEVVFGSLCVASWSPKEPLSKMQQKALLRFADIAVHAILERARLNRLSDREHMTERLAKLQKSDLTVDNVFDRALKTIRETFPEARVSLAKSSDGVLPLWNTPGISYSAFAQYLWEDTSYINDDITLYNHIPSRQKRFDRSLRAIAVKLPAVEDAYLLVESNDMRYIFDDSDAGFVQSCGLVICNVVQEYTLRKAINAKFHFFRCVSHELRTPLHAILSTCELLIEEARNTASLGGQKQLHAGGFEDVLGKSGGNKNEQATLAKAMSMLSLIDASGQTLQRVINNLLDFERLETSHTHVLKDTAPKARVLELHSLSTIDEAVLSRAMKSEVHILLDNQLPDEMEHIMTDFDLLRQCLGSVLQNALDYTEHGTVTYRVSVEEDYSCLHYDIIDTGVGIEEQHHSRIFQPFEKACISSRGPGLGLTIASRIAASLGGSLSLVSSTPGRGSHFRLSLNNPSLSCPRMLRRIKAPMPLTYHIPNIRSPTPHLMYTRRSLDSIGFTHTDSRHASLLLIESISDSSTFLDIVKTASDRQIIVHVISPSPDVSESQYSYYDYASFSATWPTTTQFESQRYITVRVPVYKNRIWRMLDKAAEVFNECELGSKWGPPTPVPPVGTILPNALINNLASGGTANTLVNWEGKKDRKSLRLLLVDDNKTNLDILRMYCRKRRFDFEVAGDGKEAVAVYGRELEKYKEEEERLAQEPEEETGSDCGGVKLVNLREEKKVKEKGRITLILMDLQMPVMDGAEATERIRGLEEKKGVNGCLIYMVTGQSSDEDKERSVKAGANGYYVKPLSLRALDDLISLHFPA